jgi:hypothetical protein
VRSPSTPSTGDVRKLGGNAALAAAIFRGHVPLTDSDRFALLNQSRQFARDPDVSSIRNHLIDLYERVARTPPELYVGNIYGEALPPSDEVVFPASATAANYGAAAQATAIDPVNNRTRWALQAALASYALTYGYDEMVRRAQSSTEFSHQIHRAAFAFANDTVTIGRLPWAILTKVNVPALGQVIGRYAYAPEAFLAGLTAGMEQIAADPTNTSGANAAFDRAWELTMVQRFTLGGRIINSTIESTNSPHGPAAMPWWGVGLRWLIDAASWATAGAYE